MRLDLEEGKRLLSERDRQFYGPGDGDPDALDELLDWLADNADMLLSAAEEAENLRAENAELDALNDVEAGDWNIVADSLMRHGVDWHMDQRVEIVVGLAREAEKLREEVISTRRMIAQMVWQRGKAMENDLGMPLGHYFFRITNRTQIEMPNDLRLIVYDDDAGRVFRVDAALTPPEQGTQK